MKYNTLNATIEEDLEIVLNFIIHELNINILNKWRSRLYPEYRSLLNIIAFRKHKLSPSEMPKFYKKKGLKYSHSRYLHSIGKFETYCSYLPELKNYLYMFFKDSTPQNKEVIVINKSELTPIQEMVSGLNSKENDELIELINLKKKSWLWKNKDKVKIYTAN